MRLSEGVSVFQLAANMGTSVEMIEDVYGKKRVRDPKTATELTKTLELAGSDIDVEIGAEAELLRMGPIRRG